eukprot:3478056-Rhodomonas_salina.1
MGVPRTSRQRTESELRGDNNAHAATCEGSIEMIIEEEVTESSGAVTRSHSFPVSGTKFDQSANQ